MKDAGHILRMNVAERRRRKSQRSEGEEGTAYGLFFSVFLEGDIGGYLIPKYRKKKWQIPKYRVENRPNTDTAYVNHIYNRFRILMVASI